MGCSELLKLIVSSKTGLHTFRGSLAHSFHILFIVLINPEDTIHCIDFVLIIVMSHLFTLLSSRYKYSCKSVNGDWHLRIINNQTTQMQTLYGLSTQQSNTVSRGRVCSSWDHSSYHGSYDSSLFRKYRHSEVLIYDCRRRATYLYLNENWSSHYSSWVCLFFVHVCEPNTRNDFVVSVLLYRSILQRVIIRYIYADLVKSFISDIYLRAKKWLVVLIRVI